MYELVDQRLAGCTNLSVGRRSTLAGLHTDELSPARRRPLAGQDPGRARDASQVQMSQPHSLISTR
jgi:ABC-type uncharacterized transport system fused permease/ATPase subunit